MQQTRRHILDIIKRRGQVTVDDIVDDLQKRGGAITAVTVRHHLKLLQQDDLVTSPELRRRNTPGRPQYIYTLTEKARTHFPNNYERLATGLMAQLRQQLPPASVNVVLEGVADHLAGQFCAPECSFEQRLDLVVDYLDENGYAASWEQNPDGYMLHTSNCPYHQLVADEDTDLCAMDLRLIGLLLGVVPRRVDRISQGCETCSYLIPLTSLETASAN